MANNTIQFKRTSTSGLLPNTTNAANSSYIPAGSFAVNLTDKKVVASDGSLPFEVGANVTNQIVTGNVVLANNATQIKFATVNSSAFAYLTQQNDDNFVFYTTNTSYGARPVYSIFANNNTSKLKFSVGIQTDGGITIPTGTTLTDSTGSQGTAGQVLTSNGTGNVYWSSSGGAGLAAGNGLSSNATTYFVLPNTGIVANSTGTFVNAAYIATISANNTTYLNGQLASYYTNATNIATGTLSWAQAPTGTVNTSGSFTFSGVHTHNANVSIATTAGIIANGSIGTAGQVLTSNATTVYWATPAATGVTSVATSNGIGGGTITSTGTLYAVAGVGAVANSTGIHVNANSGIVANSTGTFVNSAYIATISANNTTYLNGQLASYYTNATNISTGTLPWAQAPTGTVNTSGSFTFSGTETFNANVVVAGNATSQVMVGNSSGNVWMFYDSTTANSVVAQFNFNTNNFVQASLYNASTGNNASADYIVYGTGGLPSSDYVDVGINGNAFNQASWSINGPADGYLYASGNTNLAVGTAGTTNLVFFTGGTLSTNERMRITSTGNVGIGISSPSFMLDVAGTSRYGGIARFLDRITATPDGSTPSYYLPAFATNYGAGITGAGTSFSGAAGNAWMALGQWSNSTTASGGAYISLNKSNGTTVGSHVAVGASQRLGAIGFSGSDGTGFVGAADIRVDTDGAPANSVMYGAMSFWTNGGGAVPSERMRVVANGNFGIGNTTPANMLSVGGSSYFAGAANFVDTTGAANSNLMTIAKNGNQYVGLGGWMTAGAYNPLVAVGDAAIVYSDGVVGAAGLSIVPWSSNSGGIRLDTAANVTTIGITGATTITGNNQVTGTFVAGSGTTGSVTMGNDSNGSLEIGTQGRASGGSPFIDFHSAASSGDYDVRVQATGGNSTPGWGSLTLTAGSGLNVANTSANMLTVGSTGVATFSGTGGVYANNLLLQGDGTNAYVRPVNTGSNLYLGSNNINQITVAASGNLLVGATVNAASHTVGTSFVANTTQVTIAGIPLSANGGVGSAGQVLTSNGATGAPYWAAGGTTYTFSTGLVNTTGTITVNSAYIATISSNNSSYLGGVAAASYALRSDTLTHTSSNSTAFSATATSAVALQVGDSSAIRNVVAGGTMYLDVASGSATAGSIIFRNTSSFNNMVIMNTNGTQTTGLGVGTAPSATLGEIRATNNITSYYSDGRLKDIEGTITNPVEKVKKLSGVYYRSNEVAAEFGYTDKKLQVGVIAQEVESVLPEIVVPAPFDIDKDADGNEISKSGENYKTVHYDKLVPLLIEAIKEQQNQIDELKRIVDDLTS